MSFETESSSPRSLTNRLAIVKSSNTRLTGSGTPADSGSAECKADPLPAVCQKWERQTLSSSASIWCLGRRRRPALPRSGRPNGATRGKGCVDRPVSVVIPQLARNGEQQAVIVKLLRHTTHEKARARGRALKPAQLCFYVSPFVLKLNQAFFGEFKFFAILTRGYHLLSTCQFVVIATQQPRQFIASGIKLVDIVVD